MSYPREQLYSITSPDPTVIISHAKLSRPSELPRQPMAPMVTRHQWLQGIPLILKAVKAQE